LLPPVPTTQVITDVDDTVKSSGGLRMGGIALGGVDEQYARGTFYPGVVQLYLEMSKHGLPPGRPPPPVAVITARARELKFCIGLTKTCSLYTRFADAGARHGYPRWGIGPVLYGSVIEWILQFRKGQRKFKNFRALRRGSGYPTSVKYVYVGDTGERDKEAADHMVLHHPEAMRAAFLHAVGPARNEWRDYAVNGVPVVFFRTYVGAAVKAARMGVIDHAGLRRVVDAARREMYLVGIQEGSEPWRELVEDIAMAEEELRTAIEWKVTDAFHRAGLDNHHHKA